MKLAFFFPRHTAVSFPRSRGTNSTQIWSHRTVWSHSVESPLPLRRCQRVCSDPACQSHKRTSRAWKEQFIDELCTVVVYHLFLTRQIDLFGKKVRPTFLLSRANLRSRDGWRTDQRSIATKSLPLPSLSEM